MVKSVDCHHSSIFGTARKAKDDRKRAKATADMTVTQFSVFHPDQRTGVKQPVLPASEQPDFAGS